MGNGFDQSPVTPGHTLLDQGPESADEVHSRCSRGLIHGAGNGNHLRSRKSTSRHRDGTYGNAFIHHRNAVLDADLIAHLNEVLSHPANLAVNAPDKALMVVIRTVEKADTEGDGAHIQMLVLEHFKRGEYLAIGQHRSSYTR